LILTYCTIILTAILKYYNTLTLTILVCQHISIGIAEHEKAPDPDKKITVKGDKIVSKPAKEEEVVEEPDSIKTLLTGKVEQPKVAAKGKTAVKKVAAKRGGKSG
jgi:hypothetical protein